MTVSLICKISGGLLTHSCDWIIMRIQGVARAAASCASFCPGCVFCAKGGGPIGCGRVSGCWRECTSAGWYVPYGGVPFGRGTATGCGIGTGCGVIVSWMRMMWICSNSQFVKLRALGSCGIMCRISFSFNTISSCVFPSASMPITHEANASFISLALPASTSLMWACLWRYCAKGVPRTILIGKGGSGCRGCGCVCGSHVVCICGTSGSVSPWQSPLAAPLMLESLSGRTTRLSSPFSRGCWALMRCPKRFSSFGTTFSRKSAWLVLCLCFGVVDREERAARRE